MSFLERAWYKQSSWLLLLWPVSLLFRLLAFTRRKVQQAGNNGARYAVPIVIIGNISTGGTGKTPLLITLVNQLKKAGMKPGVVSRGYGGHASNYPLKVIESTDVNESGDEALVIVRNTQCPVVVDPDRVAAVDHLLSNQDVDIVLSDDGLQHYRLHRDIEIIVVDGQRLFSNGLCFPAGPLREPVHRLSEADYVFVNGGAEEQQLDGALVMELRPRFLINLLSGEKKPFSGVPFNMGNTVQAVSAIGNPDRFHQTLESLPHTVKHFTFPDHHSFDYDEFKTIGIDDKQPVVMTEKDAVKCKDFAQKNYWYLTVEVNLSSSFLEKFELQIAKFQELYSSESLASSKKEGNNAR